MDVLFLLSCRALSSGICYLHDELLRCCWQGNLCLFQGPRNELHCGEGLEGPVWCCDCSGWQTWFFQWQEKVSVCRPYYMCTACTYRCVCLFRNCQYYKRLTFVNICCLSFSSDLSGEWQTKVHCCGTGFTGWKKGRSTNRWITY